MVVMTDNTVYKATGIGCERIFYTASPFARSSLLYLQEMGREKTLPAHTFDRGNMWVVS